MIEQLIEQLKAKEKSLLAHYIKARIMRHRLEVERDRPQTTIDQLGFNPVAVAKEMDPVPF